MLGYEADPGSGAEENLHPGGSCPPLAVHSGAPVYTGRADQVQLYCEIKGRLPRKKHGCL